MVEKEKKLVIPVVNVAHNENDNGLFIQVDLSGVERESVNLDMGSNGFCLKAEGKDIRCDSCVTLGHEIMPEAAKAKFDNGLLTIDVPFKETIRGHKVPVELVA